MNSKASELEPPQLRAARHLARIYPSHGQPFTELTNRFLEHYLHLDAALQTETQSHPKSFALNLPHLGALGRFGNQILQYGFGKLIAAHCDADLIFGDWAGARIFIDSFPPTVQTSYNSSRRIINADSVSPQYIYSSMLEGHSLQVTGYFGSYANFFPNSANQFRSYFSYQKAIQDFLSNSLEADGLTANQYIALHIRRGDFVGNPSLETPISAYVEALRFYTSNFNDLRIIVVSDEYVDSLLDMPTKSVNKSKHQFDPAIQFLYDFYLIQNARAVIVSPNSTFSHTAVMLNPNQPTVVCPSEAGPFLLDNWSLRGPVS